MISFNYSETFSAGDDIIGITIKDVARYTGLSIATISKYINGGNVLEKNRVLIEDAIKKLDFRVNEIARGLKTNKSFTIGVLIPTLENVFFNRIISNIENVLLNNGYSTIICDYKEDKNLEKEKLEFLVNKMVDGIIIVPYALESYDIKNTHNKKLPIVVLDRIIDGDKYDTVLADNFNASYNATKYLIKKGHKRIAIIAGPQEIFTARERLEGFIKANKDYSIEVDYNLVKYGDYHIESGYLLLKSLVALNDPPTAVFITNYEMTLGAVMAINELNIKIPDQLSLIGFDNLQLAKVVKPALSVVIQPMERMGGEAAKTLLKRLKNDYTDFPNILRLETDLIINDSVKVLI